MLGPPLGALERPSFVSSMPIFGTMQGWSHDQPARHICMRFPRNDYLVHAGGNRPSDLQSDSAALGGRWPRRRIAGWLGPLVTCSSDSLQVLCTTCSSCTALALGRKNAPTLV